MRSRRFKEHPPGNYVAADALRRRLIPRSRIVRTRTLRATPYKLAIDEMHSLRSILLRLLDLMGQSGRISKRSRSSLLVCDMAHGAI